MTIDELQPPVPGRRAVLMVWDGMRPDLVTEEHTPHLHRLATEGVRFTDSHAVFPTVTRANSSSIATGVLPAHHGIPGNMFYAHGVVTGGPLNAGDHRHLEALRQVRAGRVLLRETLAERLVRAGGRTAVVSTGSPGSALLQHPQARACRDILINPAFRIGVDLAHLEARLGPMPEKTLPNTEQNAWFTRAITEVLLPDVAPRLLVFWHTDPDGTQHAHGLGHPLAMRAVRDADENLGAVLAALDRLGLRDQTNVVVTSDHGFSTYGRCLDIEDELVRAGLKRAGEDEDVLLAGEFVYVRDGAGRVARIVELLRALEAVGPIFTGRGGAPPLPGTHSLDVIGADGPFAPDILFSRDWGDGSNAHGYKGTAWSGVLGGKYAGSHGTIGPWDVRNTLVAAGPDFARGRVSDVPAGNVDIAPTLMHLLGGGVPAGLDGRVLSEALRDGPEPCAVPVERSCLESGVNGYRQRLYFSSVGGTRYLDFGTVERI